MLRCLFLLVLSSSPLHSRSMVCSLISRPCGKGLDGRLEILCMALLVMFWLACYQRREKVLDDLANLKASAMVLFFCHRDWWKPAGNQVLCG